MRTHNLFLLFLVSLAPIVALAQSVNDDLIAAAKRGDAESVKSLLAKGADVNAKTRYNQTPLMFASEKGHLEVVKILIEAGADVNVTDTFYRFFTALYGAASKGHAEVVKLLLEKGARGKDQALIIGAQEGQASVVKVALDMGGLAQGTLDSALSSVDEARNKEIAEMLKNAGAKPIEKKDLKPEVKVDEATLQKYAGTYRIDEARQYTFIARDGKLGGWDVRQYSFPLTAIDKNVFRIGASDDRTITFNEEDGKVVSVTLAQSGFKQTYNRVEGK
jgi:Ankyrin repeats (3 copies)